MGKHTVPTMPIYAYKAINDDLSLISDTDNLIKELCAKGVSIVYERNTVGGHSDEAMNGNAAAVEFLTSVLAGNYASLGCIIRNVTVSISNTGL